MKYLSKILEHNIFDKFNYRVVQFLIAVVLISSGAINSKTAYAAEKFNDVYCQAEFEDYDLCNISFYRKFMSAKLVKSGSNIRIPYSSIFRWSYENSSLRKRKDSGSNISLNLSPLSKISENPSGAAFETIDSLGSTLIGMINFFKTRVEHIHTFTIFYRDIDLGTKKVIMVDFDEIKYMPPMKALLEDILPQASTTESRS